MLEPYRTPRAEHCQPLYKRGGPKDLAAGSQSAGTSSIRAAHAPDASPPRAPREFSKKAIVRDLLNRTGGATLQEIVEKTGWQKHIVRGLHFDAGQEDRSRDHQHPA